MKRRMIWIMIIFILTACQAVATVEDSGMAPGDVSSSPWTGPTSPSLPTYLPSPCSGDSGTLSVSISLTGPESEPDKSYTTPGKPLDFMVTVSNDGKTEVEAEVSVKPEGCPFEWFSWTTTPMTIPAGVSRSVALQVLPDINAVAGEYRFAVEASAKCRNSGQREAKFKVQAFDYASETSVSGSGQFQINKDLRSMNSGIKSTKNVLFSGSVDALVKNEYLVDEAKGKNANFQEQDAVDNYNAVALWRCTCGNRELQEFCGLRRSGSQSPGELRCAADGVQEPGFHTASDRISKEDGRVQDGGQLHRILSDRCQAVNSRPEESEGA